MMAFGRSHLLDEIGDDHIFGSIDDALERARAELGIGQPVSPPAVTTPTS